MPRIGQDLSSVTDDDMNYEGGWTALDDGDYRFSIHSSDFKATKTGNGMRIGLELHCLEPEHQGTKLYDYLTIQHSNSDTVRIARARLKQIALAVGHENPDYVENSEELHGIPIVCRVTKEIADNPKYGDRDGAQNQIVGYYAIGNVPERKSNGTNQAAAPAIDPTDGIPF